MEMFEDGFKLMGADQTGACRQQTAAGRLDQEDALVGDPIVKFDFDLSYQCTLSMSLAELKSYCDPGATPFINDYAIFSNLEESFKQFG